MLKAGFWRGLLRDQRGNVGGAPAGGEGTGEGDADPPDDQHGSGGAGGLTEAKVNELISKAIGSRFKAFEQKIAKTFEAATDQILGKVTETLDARSKSHEPPDGKSGDKDPIIAGMQKQIDTMKKQLEDSKAESAAIKERERATALRSRVSELLAKHEIEGVRAQHAAGYLIDAAKLIRYEDDEPVFMDRDGAVDLETGLAEWAKGEEAKLYLPPRGASGSGTPPVVGRRKQADNGAAPPSKAEIGQALMSVLQNPGQ